MIITPRTKIETSPTTVVYRTPLGFSMMVVKVIIIDSSNPRIMTYSEDLSGQTPTSLFMDEIVAYMDDAKVRLGLT